MVSGRYTLPTHPTNPNQKITGSVQTLQVFAKNKAKNILSLDQRSNFPSVITK